MSKVVKDKFLTEFEEYQEKNGMRGAKRFSDSEVARWKARQPLSEEEKAKYAKKEKVGFIVLIAGVSALVLWAVLTMVLDISF